MQKKALPIYKTAVAEKKLIEIAKWLAKKWGQKVSLHYLEYLDGAKFQNICDFTIVFLKENSSTDGQRKYYTESNMFDRGQSL